MAKIGLGYGSEFHLLRFMGRLRSDLDEAIKKELQLDGGKEWLDFKYNKTTKKYDKEYVGIELLDLKKYPTLEGEWKKFNKFLSKI